MTDTRQTPAPKDSLHPRGSFSMDDGPRQWSGLQALGVGWHAIKDQPVPILGGFVLVLVIQLLVQAGLQGFILWNLGYPEVDDPSRLFDSLSAWALAGLVSSIIGLYFTLGQLRVALAAARGEVVELSLFFSAQNRLLPALGATSVIYLGVSVGLFLLIVPGIVIALGWALTLPLLADTHLKPAAALAESWEATKGQRLHLLSFFFLSGLLLFLGLLSFYVGLLIAAPVVTIAFAEVYMSITGRRTPELPPGARAESLRPASLP